MGVQHGQHIRFRSQPEQDGRGRPRRGPQAAPAERQALTVSFARRGSAERQDKRDAIPLWKDNSMRICDRPLRTLRRAVGLSALALLCAAPGFSQAAPKTGSGYVATMKDWLAVNEAMQRYRWGVEKHDGKALQSAFWADGADTVSYTHLTLPTIYSV